MMQKIDEMFEELLADIDELLATRTLGELFNVLGLQTSRVFGRLFRG